MRLSRVGLVLAVGAAALVPAAAASAVTGGEVDTGFTFVRPAPTGSGDASVNSMAVQSDHGVVHVITNGVLPNYVRRTTPSGGIDTTFGDAGRVAVDDHDRVIVLRDDRILVLGGDGGPGGTQAELRRLLPDGAPDPSFGGDGTVLLPAQAPYAAVRARSVHLLPDGAMAVAGDAYEAAGNFDPWVAVVQADGSPVPGWRPGAMIAEPDATALPNVVSGIIPDGADGYYAIGQSQASESIVKAWHFTASGPVTTTPVLVHATAIAVVPGAAGEAFVMGGGFATNPRAYVMRLEATPTSIARDPAWGDDGFARDFGDLNLRTLARQADGKLLAFGFTSPADVSMSRDVILRLDTQGDHDPGFGSGGSATLPYVSGARDVQNGALVVAPDGRVLVGSAIAGGPTKAEITRLYGSIARTSATASSTPVPGLAQEARVDVVNAGPDAAVATTLDVSATGDFTGTLATTRGTCTGTTSPWRCDLGLLPPGDSVQVTASLTAAVPVDGVLTATVSSPTYDDVPGDESATTAVVASTAPQSGSPAGPAPTTAPPTAPVGTVFALEKRPTIKGKAVVGRKLRAKPGTWSPTPTKIRYQWLRNGKRIKKATRATYRLVRKDRGKKISVQVVVRAPGMPKATARTRPKRVRS